ncbi:hypothetical protein ACIQCD_24155 [Streptomyces sp. NPDC093250]|uniref:hypothetical protein n=1 Tax=Streptomyces sp. NPDC093250 TaxID=3366036 RepID=UPI0037FD8A8A
MRALPARRIALGALCAALLAGTTGPAAMAADPAPQSDRAVSSAVLLTHIRHVDAHGSELAPVVDLVNAVLEAPGGQLPRDRAMKLGDAARAAVARAADDDPSTTVTTTTSSSLLLSSSSSSSSSLSSSSSSAATGVLLPQATETTADPSSDAIDAVREALDDLLESLLPKDDTTTATEPTTETADESTTETTDESTAETSDESTDTSTDASTDAAKTPADDLAARIDALVEALTDADPEVTTLPAPAAATPSESTTPATLPALNSLLLPTS